MNYKLSKSASKLDSAGKARYLAHALSSATYDVNALSVELSSALGGGKAEVRYYEERRASAIAAALKAGKTVRIGGVQLMPAVRGGFCTVDGEFTAGVNSMAVSAFTYGQLRHCLDEVVPENVEKPANPILSHIREEGAIAEETLTSGRDIAITGRNLKVDVTATDEGVELADLKTGVAVARADIAVSNYDSLVVSFATLPAAGRYALVVKTRSGLDGEHMVVAASREVKVALAD